MVKNFRTDVDLDLDCLAVDMASGMRPSNLIDFIISVDAHVAETSFTVEIIDQLQASLEGEIG